MNSASCSAHSGASSRAASRMSWSGACLIRSCTMSTPPAQRLAQEPSAGAGRRRGTAARRSVADDGRPRLRVCARSHESPARYDRRPETLAALRVRDFDVAVAGGGAIGLAVAWRAAQRGLHAVVLERGRARGRNLGRRGRDARPDHRGRARRAPAARAGARERGRLSGVRRRAASRPRGSTPATWRAVRCSSRATRDEAEALERELEMRRELGLGVRRLRPSEARRARAGARAHDQARARDRRRPRDRSAPLDRVARRGAPGAPASSCAPAPRWRRSSSTAAASAVSRSPTASWWRPSAW